jgi:hypothetical protein
MEIQMAKRTTVASLVCILGMFSYFCHFQDKSSANNQEDYKKQSALKYLQKERSRYGELEKSLNQEQKEICQVYLNLKEAQLSDANEKDLIGIYKQMQQLIIKEKEENKIINKRWYALQQVFGLGQAIQFTCLGIAGLCHDSEKMPLEERIIEIDRQAEISNDYRIREIVISLYTKNNRYQEALDYCQKQISEIDEGKRKDVFLWFYQFELIKTHMLYQSWLFGLAIREQGVDIDDVINIGPPLVKIDLAQYRTAKKEAEEYLKLYPDYYKSKDCLTLFSGHLIGDLEEIKEFYTSNMSKILSEKINSKTESIKPINLKD